MQGEETVNDLYNRALELVNAGKTVEALKAYKDILGKHTTTPSLRSMIYNDTGSILYSLGDTVNGEDFIKQAIFTDFFNAVAYRNLLKINSGKMKRQHKFSVVISTYNRKTFLKSCIESIRRNSFFPVEILVVCDPCKDGTEDYLLGESGKGDLIAIMNDKHIGVIESTNKGLLTSSGDYICILNDDVEVLPGWDLSIAVEIDDDPQAGCGVSLVISEKALVVNPGSYSPFKSLYFDWLGKFASIDTSYITGNTLEDFPDFQIPRECDYGVFPVMKRECFEKVGVLDTQYKHYYADPDMGYRIQELGYKNIYCPTSVIMHYWLSNHTGTSRKGLIDEPLYYEKWGLTKNGVEMTEMFKSYWAGKNQEVELQAALKTEDKA